MLNRTATATSRATRRQNVPRALQLSQAHRLSGISPQSPLRDSAFLQVSGRPTPPASAASPSLFFTPCSPLHSPRQRMEKLTACLASSMPAEIVYPSIGQVAATAEHISTFLDLYRVRATDDAHLATVKSPTSHGAEPWASLAAPGTPTLPRRRRGTLRRSRSLSDIQRGVAITSDDVHMPATRRAATLDAPASSEPLPPAASRAVESPLLSAQRAIVDGDAARMAEFRRRFGGRPVRLAARLPPPDAPLPSPPPPSALLAVKSPVPPALVAPRAVVVVPQASAYARLVTVPASGRAPLRSPQAPYWVKNAKTGSVVPKTPRTMRSERRQGWGGTWTVGSIGQVVHRLRESQEL